MSITSPYQTESKMEGVEDVTWLATECFRPVEHVPTSSQAQSNPADSTLCIGVKDKGKPLLHWLWQYLRKWHIGNKQARLYGEYIFAMICFFFMLQHPLVSLWVFYLYSLPFVLVIPGKGMCVYVCAYIFVSWQVNYTCWWCDCHEISCECVLIAAAQLDLAKLAVLCIWLLASSIQSQLPTVGARSSTEDGAWVMVGARRGWGVIHRFWEPTLAFEELLLEAWESRKTHDIYTLHTEESSRWMRGAAQARRQLWVSKIDLLRGGEEKGWGAESNMECVEDEDGGGDTTACLHSFAPSLRRRKGGYLQWSTADGRVCLLYVIKMPLETRVYRVSWQHHTWQSPTSLPSLIFVGNEVGVLGRHI